MTDPVSNIDFTKLQRKLNPPPDGEDSVKLRTGVVSAANADGTVDLTMSGVTVPSVPVLDQARGLAVGANVQVLSVRGSLLVLGGSSRGSSSVSAFNGNNPTTTSTSYTVLSAGDVHGVAFVAPASGAVQITFSGWLAANHASNQQRAFMSIQLREGSSINSGTLVSAADDDRAALSQNAVVSAYDYRYVSATIPFTGLTPGNPYNVVTAIKAPSSGGAATFKRWLLVRPL